MAKASTVMLREIVMETKFMPIGESPRNNPINPANPKLKATERTMLSIKSMLFFPKNSTFTRQ